VTPYALQLLAKREARNRDDQPLSRREIEEHRSRIDQTLARTAARRHEAIDVRTPADELELLEELEALESRSLAAAREMEDDHWPLYSRWFALWFEFIFEDGPSPHWALRRLYTLARRYRPELIAHMNGTEVGLLFGRTRAAESNRLQLLFDRLHKCGVAGFRGGGAKRESTRETFATKAKGNQNRARGKKTQPKKK